MDESQLREIFNDCGVGWLFDQDAAQRAAHYLEEMADVDRAYTNAFGRELEPSLANQIAGDVARFKPLVQAFASPMTASIRAMIFCTLDGAQVRAIRFEYRLKARAHLEVDVEYSSGEAATFTSDDVWDAEVLRHFGLMKLAGRPVIDGYYAFRDG